MTLDLERMAAAPYPCYARVHIYNRSYVFMLPRKCASHTIKMALAELDETFQHKQDYISADDISDLPRIAVVRHPVSRLVSAWRSQIWERNADFFTMPGATAKMPWADFVELICRASDQYTDKHARSMSDETHLDGCGPEYGLKVETLERDWKELARVLKWPHVLLGKHNPSNAAAPMPWVSKEQLKKLAVRYEQDARHFAYNIEGWTN